MPRFGLQIPNFNYAGVEDAEVFERVAQMACAAEESGFDSVFVMDHFYQLPPLGGIENHMLESYTLLGALAARTSRAKLGTLVSAVTYRNPALLAKQVTTLDVISGGRAILGIGAAWFDQEHEGYGFEFPPIGERLSRLDEALQICRAMFRDEHPSFEGRYYRIHDAFNRPRPLQPGGPPILVGGAGEKRTLRLVAKYADMCNIFGSPDTVRRKLAILDDHCRDVGRNPAEISRTRLATLNMTATQEEANSLIETLAKGMGASDVADRFTIGTEESVADQIRELEDSGIDTFIFNMPNVQDADGVKRIGDALTKQLG